MDPDMLISKARENSERIANLIQEISDGYREAGSAGYANNIVHLATTFFKLSKVEIDLHCVCQPTRTRKRQECIPNLSEALRMAEVAGSLRNRLMILLLAYAGLRNSTLRALVYDEAYPEPLLQDHTIKNEIERNEKYLIIIVHEIMKQQVPNACKGRLFYYTFLPPTVTECFRLYLHEMKRYGSVPNSRPIFATEDRRISRAERLKKPISMRELEVIVKTAAKRAGIKNWLYVYPHCLRKTYEDFLRNQPDDVRLDVKEREFFFGHTLPGSQDTYFNKANIEEMRAKFAKMRFEPSARLETVERVVPEEQLPSFLKDGWHFEAALPSGSAVVSRKVTEKKSESINIESRAEASISQQAKPEKNKEPNSLSTGKEDCSQEKLDLPKAQDQSCLGNLLTKTGDREVKETTDLPKSTRVGQTDLTDFIARKT
jgi:integrase